MARNRIRSSLPGLLVFVLCLGAAACGDDEGPAKKPLKDAATEKDDDPATVIDAGGVRDAGRRDAGADARAGGDEDAGAPDIDAGPQTPEAAAPGPVEPGDAMPAGDPDAGEPTVADPDAGSANEADAETDAGAAPSEDAGAPEANLPPGCRAIVRDDACDRDKRPILFIHGQLGAGDNFSYPAQLFASNGYCSDRIAAIDYNSISTAEPYNEAKLAIDEAIDKLRAAAQVDKIDLVGHGLGARLASTYVGGNADRISRYIHIANAGEGLAEPPAGVPTLCLSSEATGRVECGGSAESVVLDDDGLDALAIAASAASFARQYTFLNGEAPQYEDVQCGEAVTLEGRAITFGDNQVVMGARIEIHELGPQARERGMPVATLEVQPDGRVGPWLAQRDTAYEFVLIAPEGDAPAQTRRMYFAPFRRSDRLLRFLYASRSEGGSSALRQVNFNDGHAVVVLRRRSGAFVANRDRLSVHNIAVLDADNAGPTMGTLALYLFDAASGDPGSPGDRASRGGAVFRSSFVVGTDVYLPTDPATLMQVTFNGEGLRVPNWPSASQGLSLVVVD